MRNNVIVSKLFACVRFIDMGPRQIAGEKVMVATNRDDSESKNSPDINCCTILKNVKRWLLRIIAKQ